MKTAWKTHEILKTPVRDNAIRIIQLFSWFRLGKILVYNFENCSQPASAHTNKNMGKVAKSSPKTDKVAFWRLVHPFIWVTPANNKEGLWNGWRIFVKVVPLLPTNEQKQKQICLPKYDCGPQTLFTHTWPLVISLCY